MEDRHINFLHKKMSDIPATDTVIPHSPKKTHNKKKWIFFIVLAIMVTLGIMSYVSANKGNWNTGVTYDPVTLEPKKPEGFFKKLSYLVFGHDTTLQGEQHNRINVLLLGMGGLGHDGPYLTDTIMIASIEPSTNDIALISIPRDLGVNIPNHGWYKINHANHFGEMEKADWGGAFATQVISETFGIDIPYYIRVDFKAFEEIVDEVGGVRVDVDRTFTDYMYPTADDLYQTISFKSGPQTMDGDTTLKFVRSRHGNNGEGSDFARAARQQKVMLALKEKVLSFSTLSNPVRIKNIISALERHMTTNMGFDEIMTFVNMARGLNTEKIHNLVLDNGPNGYLVNGIGEGGAYILSPRTGNFDQISSAIQHIFDEDTSTSTLQTSSSVTLSTPADTPTQDAPNFDDITVEIQNGTWRPGLAAQVKQLLLDEEYFVEGIGNTSVDVKPIITSGVYIISKDTDIDIAKDIAHTLNINYSENVPSGITTNEATDILVVLGDDFTE